MLVSVASGQRISDNWLQDQKGVDDDHVYCSEWLRSVMHSRAATEMGLMSALEWMSRAMGIER